MAPNPDELARHQEQSWSSIPGAPPPLPPDDPAQVLLQDDFYTVPREGVYSSNCFICTDPEFALMGLPLCRVCPECKRVSSGLLLGHIAADDTVCSVCGYDEQDAMVVYAEVIQHYRASTRLRLRRITL